MLEQLLTSEQAAAFLGTTRRTLEAWRYVGAGPVFVKLRGRMVRYRPSDLEAFVANGARTNTCGGHPTICPPCSHLAVTPPPPQSPERRDFI